MFCVYHPRIVLERSRCVCFPSYQTAGVDNMFRVLDLAGPPPRSLVILYEMVMAVKRALLIPIIMAAKRLTTTRHSQTLIDKVSEERTRQICRGKRWQEV